MAEPRRINVTGVKGGTVGTANTSGHVYGGMGNVTNNDGDSYSAPNAQIGQMGRGGTAEGTTFGGSTTAGARDALSLTSAELLDEVHKAEVTDETLKVFRDNKITGAVFMDGDVDDLVKDLGISNAMDKRKLDILRRKLEGKKDKS